ncbi:sialic acid-binding Ig-like lectin 12 [Gopherus evgoodei]|uniref:sialic acid-binding Ig-like lectin 12 n=1 Tax=Gopherus evgoodei TaxID=1825980 RepID=UPI0011CF780E|nr:sialic acid-binding Ig-like lectin 12 [Gopherus evgoodei]
MEDEERSRQALREPGGQIHLVGDAPDDCSLHISDVRAGDRDHYYFRFVKGDFKYSYMVTQPLVDVTDLTEQPVLRVPEVLLSGQLVIVTCQAPGSCSGTPPQITWTGGFDYTARNVSLALMNGSISYSSELSFTPAPGDDGKELVCMVTYPSVVGVFTRTAVRLHVRSGFSLTLVVASAAGGSLVVASAAGGSLVLLTRSVPGESPSEEREEEEEDATGGEVTGNNSQRKTSTPTPKAREGDRVIAGLELKRDWW